MTVTAPTLFAHEPVLFRPAGAWVGDVIPVAYGGKFWLFYLHEVRDAPASGTGWGLVTTRDFVHFEDHGIVLTSGGAESDDFNAYTGSVVVDDDGTAHLFYTGHNPWRLAPDGGSPVQLVMHATSSDGMGTWQKHGELTFGAPQAYEAGDWRDPFVFRAAPDRPWRMLLAARHTEGPARRRGVIAQMTSTDLLTWTETVPFWDPRRYITHECPEVFQWGDWWYLVYSEFSESFTTRYRMAKNVDGPWSVPEHDSVDGRAFYAAKSVVSEGRRFFVGWIATKAGGQDDGEWEWAGTMSVLEAQQEPDGSLAFCLPAELVDEFRVEVPLALVDVSTGTGVDTQDRHLRLAAPNGYAALVSNQELPGQFFASVTIDIADGTRECGLLIRSTADGDQSYVIRLEPQRGRVVFDRWPRRRTGPMQWQVSGDQPFAVELERPCSLAPGLHVVDLLVDGTACVAVVDKKVVLSARIYDRTTGRIGLFVGEGEARLINLYVLQRSQSTTPTKEAQ